MLKKEIDIEKLIYELGGIEHSSAYEEVTRLYGIEDFDKFAVLVGELIDLIAVGGLIGDNSLCKGFANDEKGNWLVKKDLT